MSARTFSINKSKRFGNVTVFRDDSQLTVVLHQTDVVIYTKGLNTIHLDNGGWFTPTTKTAINNALNQLSNELGQDLGGISQAKGQWLYNGKPFTRHMEIKISPLCIELN